MTSISTPSTTAQSQNPGALELPTPAQAEAYLREAEARNPGPWVAHSRFVAQAARAIAERCADLDPSAAHTLGLLHDIGRREGVTAMRHAYDGYRFMLDEGWPLAARICITHSLPVQHLEAAAGKWDCSPEQMDELRRYLAGLEYDDYDRLLQLCDSLAVSNGFCLIEQRLVDVAVRHAYLNEFTVPKWRAILSLKRHFDDATGGSIYRLLPGVVENTFD